MMTREMVIAQVNALGEDASYYVERNGDILVTFENFERFDDDWNEVKREFDNEEAINAFEDRLADEASKIFNGYYRHYQMDGFTVIVGYPSMDI